jgi:esterase/lipase
MPIRGLYELRLMVAELQRRLPDIKCPVEILQGTEDKVVKPESAEIIKEKIGSEIKRIHMIESNRHGIINENIGNTHETIISMLDSLMGMKKFEQI